MSRAFDFWFHHPDKWRKMMVNGMNIDFSWNLPSDKYLEICSAVIEGRKPNLGELS